MAVATEAEVVDTVVEEEEDTVEDTVEDMEEAEEEVTVVVVSRCFYPRPTLIKAGGDRMGNLGAGLHNIDWATQQLTKFEKKSVSRY